MKYDDSHVMSDLACINLASLSEKEDRTICIVVITIPQHYECLQCFGHPDHQTFETLQTAAMEQENSLNLIQFYEFGICLKLKAIAEEAIINILTSSVQLSPPALLIPIRKLKAFQKCTGKAESSKTKALIHNAASFFYFLLFQ